MSVVATIPINNFLGTATTPASSIPDNSTDGAITMDGSTMTDPTLKLSITLDFSPDGGLTWASTSPGPLMNPFPVIATYEGGTLDKHGNPATTYGPMVAFPQGTNRKIRGIFTVDGVPLTTTATISLTP
jgi:hypothetical protein